MGNREPVFAAGVPTIVKIFAAGLSPQSTSAVEFIARELWPDCVFVHQRLLETNTLALACDICLLDLLGLGLGRWSDERQAEVMAFVGTRPTVLLIPPGSGGGWMLAIGRTELGVRQSLLQHPVGAALLRDALTKAGRQNPAPTAFTTPTASPQEDRVPAPHPTPVTAPPPAEHDFRRLSDGGYDALLLACPDMARSPYLNLICNIVMRRTLNEVRVTPQSGAVIHPAENWVASNIPTVIRKRLTEHEVMLQLVKVEQPPPDAAYDHAQKFFGRRVDGRRPLDAFVWSLVFTTFEKAPPVSTGDIRFVMHRFPNFTRLPHAPDLFIQLSLICLQQPRSIAELKKTFSRHDPNLVTLFVLCIVLSGMATVLQASAPLPQSKPKPKPKRATATEATRKPGFFRSLLDKLF